MQKTVLLIVLISFMLTSCYSMDENATSKYNPKAAAYNVQLGLAYLKQGNRQRAKQKLLKALEEAPDSLETNDAMAYFYENTQDNKKAEMYYQRAIEWHPEAGAALNNYGAFLCREKRYDEADIYFLKAIADPEYLNTARAYENAGLCALAANQSDKAQNYFKRALAEDPSLKQSAYELEKLS